METKAHAQPKAPTATLTATANHLLQRSCACGGASNLGGECNECDKKKLQRKAVDHRETNISVPPIVDEVLRSNGEPFDPGVRSLMEAWFEHDFSQVRVHTDARASESARTVNALAYTVGKDVVFASGRYQPQTHSGRHLIAHELAHTIQQGGQPRAAQAKLEVGEEESELEKEADRIADRVVRGGLSGSAPPLPPPPPKQSSSTLLLQRTPDEAGEADEAAAPEPAEETHATTEAAAPATGLIVEDDAGEITPGKMRKSEFLDQLRSAACAAADAELARVGRSTDTCPYISRAFEHYRTQTSARLERGLRRYAPEAAGATTAHEYIDAVSARVGRAVGRWAETGQISDVPEELAGEFSGMGLLSGAAGFLGGAIGGLLGGVGRALSGLAGMFFKERAGGARTNQAELATMRTEPTAGQTLDAGVRARMESAFSHDFSRVRVYTDAPAAEMSATLNARAFTIGSDVGFGAGEYRPGTLIGDALIAHELAHVVQQGDAVKGAGVPLTKQPTATTDGLEEDADMSAVFAVASIWGGFKHGLVKVSRQAMPRLKSGLQLQRCSHDYEIRGVSTDTAADSIFFDRRSASVEDSQKSKIEALKQPPARALRLYSFVSEDENIPPSVGVETAQARYTRVDEALRHGANPHTGDQLAGDSTHPGGLDTTSGQGNIDYRSMRKVKVLDASATSSGERDCSGGGEQACSDEPKFTSAQTKARDLIDAALTKISTPLTPASKALLDTHFHTSDDATRDMAATVVRANLTSDRDHILTQMTPVGTAGTSTVARQPGHVCVNECVSTCGPTTSAYNNGIDADALMTLCDTPRPSAFMQQSDESLRGLTLIHEGLHGITISTDASGATTTGGDDLSYRWQRLIRFLDTPNSLINNDTYVLFVSEANGLSTVSGADIIDDPDTGVQASRALAFLQGWLIWASQEMSSLYSVIERSQGAGSWVNTYYRDTMTRIAGLFEMTAPPGLPSESDQVKVAAIVDRLRRLRQIPNDSLVTQRSTSGSTHWEEGPVGPLTLGTDFYGLPADATRNRRQVDLILRKMLAAAPDISSGAEDKYVRMIEQIRDHRGGNAPDEE
ncbi:MAG: DUF4157 domain-containing protein [Acidobacteriota bacterium]